MAGNQSLVNKRAAGKKSNNAVLIARNAITFHTVATKNYIPTRRPKNSLSGLAGASLESSP